MIQHINPPSKKAPEGAFYIAIVGIFVSNYGLTTTKI